MADAARTREIAREVLLDAFGASATPFVPVPFVDDWVHARVLRRIARKVLMKHRHGSEALARAVVEGYLKEGARPFAASVMVGAVRFVVRKVAVVLDVKKSHDVFGEAIAFAVALDLAAEMGEARDPHGLRVGGAIHRALAEVGSGAVEALVRACREAWTGGQLLIGDAVGREIDAIRARLVPVMLRELTPWS